MKEKIIGYLHKPNSKNKYPIVKIIQKNKKLPKLRLRKIFWICFITFFILLPNFSLAVSRPEVADWCKKTLNVCMCDAMTCLYCYEKYSEYHNITLNPDCPPSDTSDSFYNKMTRETPVLFHLFIIIIIIYVLGQLIYSLKKKKIEVED